MKLFLVALFSSIVLSAKGCDTHFDACEDIADIAQITCESGGCSVVNGSGADDDSLGYLVAGLKTIDADMCREKCKEQAAIEDQPAQCKFFLFHKGHNDVVTCSLQTGCGDGDQYCAKPDCFSGELGCDDEGNAIKECTLSKETTWDAAKFHIICTSVHDGDVNIYNAATTTIPPYTVCSTVRMCDTWADIEVVEGSTLGPYYRKLAVMCDGTTGQWVAREDTGSKTESEAMIAETNKIAEPVCPNRCEALTLTKYAGQSWADLICDMPLGEGNTLADTEDDGPNSCILLCDNHLRMSIECGFTGNGEKHWHDIHGEVLTDDTIICPP